MRIAVDVRSLMEGRHSGVEEYTTQILRHMAIVAPQHIFYAFYNSFKEVQLPVFPANVQLVGYRYSNKIFHSSQFLTGLPKWDSLVRGDVFFAPNVRMLPLSRNIPLVAVAHDLSYELFPEFLNTRRRVWHRIVQPRALMHRSNAVIAVSEHTKEDLMNIYALPSDKISVVHSGLSSTFKHVSPAAIQAARAQYSLPKSFVLYLGRFEPRKNIQGIIEAFSAIASHVPHDLVLGGEVGWKQEEIVRARENSPHANRIHMLGFIPEEHKAALYAAADLFVYPSFYEGFGFPPLEALSVGTPVVTSFNSALPEIVGKWATLIDPYNTPQLAAVLADILADPQRVSRSVRADVVATYQWEEAARQTVAVLENVVG